MRRVAALSDHAKIASVSALCLMGLIIVLERRACFAGSPLTRRHPLSPLTSSLGGSPPYTTDA